MENTNTKGPLDQDENKIPGETEQGSVTTNSVTEKKDDKDKKTVEVEAEVLDRILKTIETQGEKIKILTEVADKNRLNRVEEMRAQGKLVKKVNLNTYDKKIIMAWKTIKDDVYMDNEGRLHEDQIIGLYFRGEKEMGKQLDVRSFSRLIVKIPVEVIEESKDRDGNTNFTVQTGDGEEIKIDARFIN